MKYRDLVQFDPIETVIQLRDADKAEGAKRLVGNYVISEEMARRLVDVIAAHLDFRQPDAKGIFVVGNYGTGKSHLMAMVSALAEDAQLLPLMKDASVREAFEPFAGRYLVARFEIGAVKTPLRDIVVRELEKHLKSWGVDYAFPPVDRITNHKDSIEAMLAAVESAHPGKGVLVVVDELLDYLKALGEGAVSAFNFLRELGEATSNGRFRVIAGVQETLINSPTFGFLASLISKVAARFAEVWITRQDLAFVVGTRLLGKSPEQRDQIRTHLERFMPLFPAMSQAREEYVRLFPVHPRYIQLFEQIDIAEKREVLKTLSHEMNRLLDQDVPSDEPGLIAYDSYWRLISQTPSYLADPSVGQVSERSAVVASKVESSLPKAQYRPAAARIVDALSVYRLAVGGIRTPIGLAPADLRDDLALMLPVPERDPEFLTTTIESVLKEVLIAVNGQFVSKNESGQYYLDIDKSIDYDAQVSKKVATLEPIPDRFDQYYFDVLTRALDITNTVHVPGMRIWAYELDWPRHNVTRPGYLFFGSPNERSTAQPPRTFYVYFLAYFSPTSFEDARRDDEVFFRLARASPEAIEMVTRYAAATELSLVSSGEEKAQYAAIADRQRKAFGRWIVDNLVTAFDVTSGGDTSSIGSALGGGLKSFGTSTARELTNALASSLLAAGFDRRFVGYPAFPGLAAPVTEASRAQTATEGLKYIAGTIKTEQGSAVVDGLGLLDGGVVDPSKSPYAAWVRVLLDGKPVGHVLNRSEVVTLVDGVEVAGEWKMEPEWLSVVLLAMAYRGEIEISAGGQSIDATNIALGASQGAESLGRFKTVQRPKIPPMDDLRALMSLLGSNPNLLAVDQDAAVQQLQLAIAAETTKTLEVMSRVPAAQLAGTPVWDPPEAESLRNRLDDYREFLDRVASMNTAGKLKQYKAPTNGLVAMSSFRAEMGAAADRLDTANRLQAVAGYLRDAKTTLGPEDPWLSTGDSALGAARAALTGDPKVLGEAMSAMSAAKAVYITRYLDLHNAARLDMKGDERKVSLLSGNTMRRLNLLESVPMLSAGLTPLKHRIAGLMMCRGVDALELEGITVCQACQFRPGIDPTTDAAAGLRAVEDELGRLNDESSGFIAASLEDPIASDGLRLLSDERAAAVRNVAAAGTIPDPSVIQDLNTVLQGMKKVPLSAEDVIEALRAGGPATTEELNARFQGLVDSALAGKDRKAARLVIE